MIVQNIVAVACRLLQDDEWILDTGASVDVAGEMIGEASKRNEFPLLATGSGTVRPPAAMCVDLVFINEKIEAVVLRGSPNALALGRRCALQGYDSYWRPWRSKPELFGLDERAIECEIDAHLVPSQEVRRAEGCSRNAHR